MISFSFIPSYKFIGVKVELQVYGSIYNCKVVYGSIYHCRFLTPSKFNVFVFLSMEPCSLTIKQQRFLFLSILIPFYALQVCYQTLKKEKQLYSVFWRTFLQSTSTEKNMQSWIYSIDFHAKLGGYFCRFVACFIVFLLSVLQDNIFLALLYKFKSIFLFFGLSWRTHPV